MLLVVGGIGYLKFFYLSSSAELERIMKIETTLTMNESQIAALADVRDKLSKDINDYSGRLNLAKMKNELLDYAGAEVLYKECLGRKPQDILVLNNLASMYYDLKRYDEAEQKNYDILAVSPKWINAYTNLYEIYQFHKKDDRAKLEPVLIRGIAEWPEMERDLVVMTAVYYDELMGNTAKAIEYYERALSLNPNDQTSKNRLAELKK